MGDYRNEQEAGNDSYGSSPYVEYEPVDIQVDSVESFGNALMREAENVGGVLGDIKQQLQYSGSGDRGREADQPIGAEPEEETLHAMVTQHGACMDDMNKLMESVQVGIQNLGAISLMLTQSFGSQDALNAASVDDVQSAISDIYRQAEGSSGEAA